MNRLRFIIFTIATITLINLSACNTDDKNNTNNTSETTLISNNELVLMETKQAIDPYYLDTAITVPYEYKKQNNELPNSFIVDKTVAIDSQGGNECSACSSAYMLRFYGFEADYLDIYNNIEAKQADGLVYPKGIDKLFDTYEGLDAVFYHGTVENLEDAISMGLPQIVLIHISTDNDSLHYVTVVGYDEDKLYLQESCSNYRNEENELYNRSVSKEDFEKMWNVNIDCCDHIFISVVNK